jgi:DNA-binding FrmR family transcriptional regulator
MNTILKNLKMAVTDEQLDDALKACADIMTQATDAQKKAISVAVSTKSDEILARSKQTRAQAEALLREIESESICIEIAGQRYPLSDWLTISQYCERFGLSSTSVVTNWLKRGVIPTENTVLVKPLNNLRLIRAIPYT